MSQLEEELDQEKKKYTMLEIKLRNSLVKGEQI